jgi:hypothetical protein
MVGQIQISQEWLTRYFLGDFEWLTGKLFEKLKGQFNAKNRKKFCSNFRSEIKSKLKGQPEIK